MHGANLIRQLQARSAGLEAVGYGAGVRAGKDLEGVGYAVAIENVVELAGIDAQSILIADVDGDCLILAQIANVLINECEGP